MSKPSLQLDGEDFLDGHKTSAMSENTSVLGIDLTNNPSITSAGRIVFFNVLLNGNHSLEQVESNLDSTMAGQDIWDVISLALCDKSSISRILSSNHAVRGVSCVSRERKDVKTLLKMNENHDKAEVARQKILK